MHHGVAAPAWWAQVLVLMFRVVQPYGRDKARDATVISEHPTAGDAFAEIDRLSAQMVRTGASSDAVDCW